MVTKLIMKEYVLLKKHFAAAGYILYSINGKEVFSTHGVANIMV